MGHISNPFDGLPPSQARLGSRATLPVIPRLASIGVLWRGTHSHRIIGSANMHDTVVCQQSHKHLCSHKHAFTFAQSHHASRERRHRSLVR